MIDDRGMHHSHDVDSAGVHLYINAMKRYNPFYGTSKNNLKATS